MNRAAAKILALAGYAAFCAWFYYRYVPLLPAYQLVLAPILLFLAVRTAMDEDKGLVAFSFIFPLINVVPYFFGLGEGLPLAPAALTAFLAFWGGRMAGRLRAAGLGAEKTGVVRTEARQSGVGQPGSGKKRPKNSEKTNLVYPRAPVDDHKTPGGAIRSLGLPLTLLAAWGAISGLIAFLRYMDFFPFLASGIHEVQVNAAGVTSGGARMSVVFATASLLCGIAMFGVYRRACADPVLRRRLVGAMSLSAAIAFLFGYVQKAWAGAPGNIAYWKSLGQINATFKDPNSLAAFIAGFLPLLVAFAVYVRGGRRILWIAVGASGLILLPLSGSRSGIAAVGVAAVVFLIEAFARARRAVKRRVAAAAFGITLIFVLVNTVIIKDSSLIERIGWSVYQLKEKTAPGDFFNHRLTLWAGARSLIRAAPLTGIGLGSFIVEFPSFLHSYKPGAVPFTDTALNLGLQIGAETGVIGLVLTLAFLVVLMGRMIGIIRGSEGGIAAGVGGEGGMAGGSAGEEGRGGLPRDWIQVAAVSGLAAFFFNFLFHTYAASFEVQFLFWFLAAIVMARGNRPESASEPQSFRGTWIGATRRIIRRWGLSLGVLALLFGLALSLALSLGSFSIGARADEYGWKVEYGLYAPEPDPEVGSFRWTSGEAGFSVNLNGAASGTKGEILIRALNPDLASRPVSVRIYRSDRRFRKHRPAIAVLALKDNAWVRVNLNSGTLDLAAGKAVGSATEREKAYYVIEPNRSWSPNKVDGSPDKRSLGVCLKIN